ncbi:response regulator [Ramlibacter sp. AN1015]|uniref:response regulator n=1 Tax=Ramlibacter sp. AN1015 TaxID=3133428 RepID=UPI0030BC7636
MQAANLRAFVVEDNPTIRENLVGTLEELTCVRVVGTSGTEDEAVAWVGANAEGWDLLIVDLFLQRGSGMHLVQKLSARRPGQKVVIFSNYVNASVRKRCAQLGVDAVFDKSTEIDSLVDYCVRHCYLKANEGAQAAQVVPSGKDSP